MQEFKNSAKWAGRIIIGISVLAVVFYPKIPVLKNMRSLWERAVISGVILAGTPLVMSRFYNKSIKSMEDKLYTKNKAAFEHYCYEGDEGLFAHFQ